MSAAMTQLLKHVQEEFGQTDQLQQEILHQASVIKAKDAAMKRKDKELANVRVVLEDRRKKILNLKTALKGITLILVDNNTPI